MSQSQSHPNLLDYARNPPPSYGDVIQPPPEPRGMQRPLSVPTNLNNNQALSGDGYPKGLPYPVAAPYPAAPYPAPDPLTLPYPAPPNQMGAPYPAPDPITTPYPPPGPYSTAQYYQPAPAPYPVAAPPPAPGVLPSPYPLLTSPAPYQVAAPQVQPPAATNTQPAGPVQISVVNSVKGGDVNVVAGGGMTCPRCHVPLVKNWRICSVIIIVVIGLLLSPIGWFCFFLVCSDNVRSWGCPKCGYGSECC